MLWRPRQCTTRLQARLLTRLTRPAHLHRGSHALDWVASTRGSLPSHQQAPRQAIQRARPPAASVSYQSAASVSYQLTSAMGHRRGSISELVWIRQWCQAGVCSGATGSKQSFAHDSPCPWPTSFSSLSQTLNSRLCLLRGWLVVVQYGVGVGWSSPTSSECELPKQRYDADCSRWQAIREN
jgi:hypothetical protein